MPGIAWLALHPPKHDIFPWWTGWFLNAAFVFLAFAFAVLLWVIYTVIADEIRDRRK